MISLRDVTYTYPFSRHPAVEQVSFDVAPGELVLCTGASGCGKSTVMRLVNGLCPHYFQGKLRGQVLVDGRPTAERPLHELAAVVGTLFQDPEQQFFALGVEDELAFAHEWSNRSSEETGRLIRQAAVDFGLESVLGLSVHQLSEGQKQKVGLATIMSRQPRALILDEPTANLDPESTAELAARLAVLKAAGLAILVVDHRLYWLEGVADRVLVMQGGRIREQGPFAMLKDETLRRRYGLRAAHVADPRVELPDCPQPAPENQVDRETRAERANAPANPARQGFVARDVHFAYPGKAPLFQGADIGVPPGVTALVGDNGTGKTTLARLLTGLTKTKRGTFFLDGQPVRPADLLTAVGIVLQNADHQLHMKTVRREVEVCLELAARVMKRPRFFGRADGPALVSPVFQAAPAALDLLRLFALDELADRHPQSLSGGEKQRLVIACAFAKQPAVLILDEPTSGLDGENMRRIADALSGLAERGVCVLVITHDLELMALACSRALRLPLRTRHDAPAPSQAV